MKIKTDWKSPPSFEDQYPNEWARIEKLLKRINLPFTCHIGYEDVGSKVYLVMSDGEDRHDDLVYTLSKFTTISEEKLTRDIFERAQRPIGQKRKIIQGVFDHFQQLHEWPSSRLMSVDLRHLGDYYKLAKGIGVDFIRTGEDHDEEAITRLTIYGVSLCSKADEYLDTFLKVLKFLVAAYLDIPQSPLVHSYELVDEAIAPFDNDNIIYEIISAESGLISGSSYERSGEFTFTVSPLILKYETVNTIEDYLRIAYYPRIWGQSEDNVEPNSGGVMEFVGAEGIIVTGSKPATESKPSKQFDYDLFISYASEDKSEALVIKKKAEALGLKCFRDKDGIKKGKYWDPEIRKALIKSKGIVVLATPNSIDSKWIYAEAGAAWVLEKDLTPIILRCDFSQLHHLLQQREGVEYHEIDQFLKDLAESKNAS